MTGQQAVRLIDRLLERGQQPKLNDIQSTIVLQIWAGDTYRSIADRLSYDLDYIKQIAARLWKSLAKLLGENICKSNIKSVLERCQESIPLTNLDGWADFLSKNNRLDRDISHCNGIGTDLQTIETWMISDRIATIAFFGSAETHKPRQATDLDPPQDRYQRHVRAKIQSLIWQNSNESVTLNMLVDEIFSVLKVKNAGRKYVDCLIVNCYF